MAVSYAELHCHSNASFLDGVHPEELAEEAARLGLEALAITDHDGMYGIVRFAERPGLSLPTIFGAELTLTPAGAGLRGEDRDPRPGRGHPGGAGTGAGGVCAAGPGHLGGADGRGQGAPGASWGGWPDCTAGAGWS